MKKNIYVITTGVFLAFLLACAGQPESSSSDYRNSSVILGDDLQEIEFYKIGLSQQAELIGLWHAENARANSYSRLGFDENGNFREDIYSELTGESLFSIQGQYHAENSNLTFMVSARGTYQYSYTLVASNRLRIHPITVTR